jgi:hypothetical protein
VIHPSLKGKRVTTKIDHYGLLASNARVGGIPPLGGADQATDLLAAFGL